MFQDDWVLSECLVEQFTATTECSIGDTGKQGLVHANDRCL